MYFLAHMQLLLDSLPEKLQTKRIMQPLITGTWGPDIGYFSLFSPKLKIFGHYEKPPVTLFPYKTKEEKEAFKLGWKAHLFCDELIHEKIIHEKEPFAPPVIVTKGMKKRMGSLRRHLGREIGLDVYLYQKNMRKRNKRIHLLEKKELYFDQRIKISGFKRLQNYVYRYINNFLPYLNNGSRMARSLIEIFDYQEFFEQKKVKVLAEEMIKKAKLGIEKMIEEESIRKL
jgi:hypothetical protein